MWTERHHWGSLARFAHWSLTFVMALMDMLEMQYSCCLEEVFLWHTEMLASALALEQLVVKRLIFFSHFHFKYGKNIKEFCFLKSQGMTQKSSNQKQNRYNLNLSENIRKYVRSKTIH